VNRSSDGYSRYLLSVAGKGIFVLAGSFDDPTNAPLYIVV